MPRTRPAPSDATKSVADARAILRELAPVAARLAAADAGIVAQQVAIASIASPTGGEGPRGQWVARELRAAGAADVRSDDAGNVIACFRGSIDAGPVVVLSHLDTVRSYATTPHITCVGQRLVGPGINDNARGLAVAIAIARELSAAEVALHRPVMIVATTGEEGAGDLRGAKHFFASRRERPAAAIALDGAGDDRIVNAALGSRRLRIGFDGPGGHSWSAFGVANAIHAAAACATALARLRLADTPRATVSVGRIGGGQSVNAIPQHAWLEVDARSADPATLERLERDIRRAVAAAVDDANACRTPGSPPLSATVERFGNRPSGETPADQPLVAASLAITRAFGIAPRLALASTDANVPMSLGIPAIAIGAGGIGGDAHTDQEWFENVEGPRGIARALAIIVAASRL